MAKDSMDNEKTPSPSNRAKRVEAFLTYWKEPRADVNAPDEEVMEDVLAAIQAVRREQREEQLKQTYRSGAAEALRHAHEWEAVDADALKHLEDEET